MEQSLIVKVNFINGKQKTLPTARLPAGRQVDWQPY
jgi:hypothetical protein